MIKWLICILFHRPDFIQAHWDYKKPNQLRCVCRECGLEFIKRGPL